MPFSTEDYDVAMHAAMAFVEGTSHGTVMRYEKLVQEILKAVELRQAAELAASAEPGAPPPRNGFYWIKLDQKKSYWSDPGWLAARWLNSEWYVPSSYMGVKPEEVVCWTGPLAPPP